MRNERLQNAGYATGRGALELAVAGWSDLSVKLWDLRRACFDEESPGPDETTRSERYMLNVFYPNDGASVRCGINGERLERRQPFSVVCEPGDEVCFGFSGGCTVWTFFFQADWASSAGPAPHLRLPEQRLVIPHLDRDVQRLCLSLSTHWNGDELDRFRCQALFQELLYVLLRQTHETVKLDPRMAIEETRRYMDRHFAVKLSIEHLARRTGTSEGYFMQLFRKVYGCSPLDYIAERRLEEAQRWLRRAPNMPVRDVSRTVGYEDEGYFSRRFKQKLGITPSAYRTSNHYRAVALNYHTIGYLLALQIIPSGARLDPRYVREYHDRYADDVAVRLDHLQDPGIVLQTLARHEPDLIVVRENIGSHQIAELKRLAPVLVLPWHDTVHWRTMFRLAATFLHKETQAERWLQQYDRRAEHVRRRIPAAVRRESLLIVGATDQGMVLVGRRHAGSVMYEDLGFAPAFTPPTALHPMQPEQLASIDADRILLIADSGTAARHDLQTLYRSSAWRTLRAVHSRKVHRVDRGLWFEYTPHAHLWVLQAAAALFS
ncbi:helix-turn-helix domain-containing protein [Paenibacillus sp. IB182496]|uniref:Helix-turn-helix domain-containing protein n=1 Tax=Paenibacillus sabuli TaxID=2772509 RepID=A0A927BSJ5_9BACL|nr:helix-turn-helix domain-containing protein [Paenibacillus sabuli]MBD2844759.1 helix-turn-helix domain-containing protein [Paenibacillus sabuli]